jgi:dTDP-4-dehydrorhamnose 3,5-epimerase-like enzyme
VVTHDVPARAIVLGNPARVTGYVDTDVHTAAERHAPGPEPVERLAVAGVALYRMPSFRDLRGVVAVAELGEQIPFQPRRLFVVHDVPSREVRSEHAHRTLHQFLVCVKGEVSLIVDDGARRQEVLLRQNELGVHVPPMVWAVQYRFSADAVLVVLASDAYDPADYLRDYGEYQRLVAARGPLGAPG